MTSSNLTFKLPSLNCNSRMAPLACVMFFCECSLSLVIRASHRTKMFYSVFAAEVCGISRASKLKKYPKIFTLLIHCINQFLLDRSLLLQIHLFDILPQLLHLDNQARLTENICWERKKEIENVQGKKSFCIQNQPSFSLLQIKKVK